MTPVASEGLTKDGIIWFLQSLWLLVETREVPAYHLLHSGERVILKHCPGGGMGREEITHHLQSRCFHELSAVLWSWNKPHYQALVINSIDYPLLVADFIRRV